MEWLLTDKTGDIFLFKDVLEVSKYLCITKSQVDNLFRQSLKHTNKLHKSGFYLQRLYNDICKPLRTVFIRNKYIYFPNHTQENKNYCLNNL
tara:strand:+ start:45 stop:320 length:276 start_codon:yes stop_codon:yes gene_type:complete